MLSQGYGAMVNALATDAHLDVRFGWRVTRAERGANGRRATLHFADELTHQPQDCDFLVLTGPIPEFVVGSLDKSRPPILSPTAPLESQLFGTMRPMQFLISLVEFSQVPTFETLEYWPSHFTESSAVIVRRDVGYAESGDMRRSHAIGGVQSYSYWPVPTANRSTHWAAQRAWAAQHQLDIKRVLAQNYIDTYLFHYTTEEIVGPLRKPWRLRELQLADGLCNCTLYVGGAASFETVEDVFQSSLQLVAEVFDADIPLTPSPPPDPPPLPSHAPPAASALEQLLSTLPCADVDRFVRADTQTWTEFLRYTPGYVRKSLRVQPVNASSVRAARRGGHPDMCEVWATISWYSRELWKAIPQDALERTQQAFVMAFGSEPPKAVPQPTHGNGLTFECHVSSNLGRGRWSRSSSLMAFRAVPR